MRRRQVQGYRNMKQLTSSEDQVENEECKERKVLVGYPHIGGQIVIVNL